MYQDCIWTLFYVTFLLNVAPTFIVVYMYQFILKIILHS